MRARHLSIFIGRSGIPARILFELLVYRRITSMFGAGLRRQRGTSRD